MTEEMPDLDFSVVGARAAEYCMVPTLNFELAITASRPVEAVALDCQIRVEAQARRYGSGERDALFELFGKAEDWPRTVRSLLWTHASVSVGRIAGPAQVELPVPCTFDFNVVTTKYFAALEEGQIPLLFLFSGAIFYLDQEGALQVGRVAWTKEAGYRLPVSAWQDLMELYYPNSTWLCLRRDAFSQLAAFKAANALPTFEQTLERLLGGAAGGTRP
jgi:hypothetical protein